MSRTKSAAEKAATKRAYQERNRELYRAAYRKHYHANRANPDHRAAVSCRALVTRVVRCIREKVGTSAGRHVGYTVEQFKAHIESLFEPWMTWANHGEWHVDHVVPLSWFIAQGCTDPAIINALENLRPLRAQENMQKSWKVPIDVVSL
jgi:hypothetical protein